MLLPEAMDPLSFSIEWVSEIVPEVLVGFETVVEDADIVFRVL